MFVVTEQPRAISNNFIYDSRCPMGSNVRKACSSFSWMFCQPYGATAHTNFFNMTEEKEVSKIPFGQPFNRVDYHTQQFHETVEKLYSFAKASDYIEVNNELVNCLLEKGSTEDEEYHPDYIKRVILLTNFQNKFLTALQENWATLKKVTNQIK